MSLARTGFQVLPKAIKQGENAVKKMVFKPFLVLDKPLEVEQKFERGNN
jgi:hypothetical protein